MRSTFLIAVMLVLSLAVSGCSNSRATDHGAQNAPASDTGDYSADTDGTVSDGSADEAGEEDRKTSGKTAANKDNSVADAADRVTDDVKDAADNVTDAADDVVEGAADTVKGAADTVTGDADDTAGDAEREKNS